MSQSSLIKDNEEISSKKYPLLAIWTNFKPFPVKTNWYFNVDDMDSILIEKMESFFQEHSLKDALIKHFKIASPKINDFINKELIHEENNNWIINLNYYLILDMLKAIFLEQEKPNYDGFLKTMSNNRAIAILAPYYNIREQIKSFLNDNFSESQKVSCLLNSQIDCELIDVVNMYVVHSEHMKEALKKVSWVNKDNIKKCHDIFSAENSKIEQKNFSLKQETHYNISNLINEKMSNGEYFVSPNNFHELIQWGTLLGHCIGSLHYSKKAANGDSLLLGVFNKKDQIKYTLEISQKKLIQIQGIAGTKPDNRLMSNILSLLIKYGLIEKQIEENYE